MAGSRLEKIGTIYTRTTGLLNSGALNWADRPLWYDVYEAFPPKDVPQYDRPVPNVKIRQIFYEEDKIRAMFHKNNKQIGSTNLTNDKWKSIAQQFIETYKKIGNQYEWKESPQQIYQEALEMLRRERESKRDLVEDDVQINLSSAFKQAEEQMKPLVEKQPTLKINVSDILKD